MTDLATSHVGDPPGQHTHSNSDSSDSTGSTTEGTTTDGSGSWRTESVEPRIPDHSVVVTSAALPVVSEECAFEVVRSPGVSSTCEVATQMCVVVEEASSRESDDDGTVELRLSATVLGPAVSVPFILGTGSQFNVMSCAVLNNSPQFSWYE